METCEQLVRQAQAKDADAFATLIAQFERMALALAYSITGNSAVASDVVQDAFIRAWQKLDSLQEPARFGGWLCRIVRNFATDAVRRGPRSAESLDVTFGAGLGVSCNPRVGKATDSDDPRDRMQQRETADRIGTALTTLDDLTRSAVVLRYYEDLSSKEIGDLLELSPAAVDMRLSRARTQLRKALAWAIDESAETTAGGLSAG